MERFPKQSPQRERSEPTLEYGPKTEAQRHHLRNTLLALGVIVTASTPEKDSDTADDVTNPTNQIEATDTDAPANNADDVYATNGELYTSRPPTHIPDKPKTESSDITFDNETETNEAAPEVPTFEAYTRAAAAAYTMRRDQVVLTDSWGQMLTENPIDLYNAAGYTPEEMTWRYQGGPPVGIPGLLTQELRAQVSATSGIPKEEILIRHEYLGMLKDEFAEYESLQEAALHNANQEVPHDRDNRTFLEVIADEFQAPIEGADGEMLSALLKEYLPALISKESLFNVDAVSSAGARGALQFMPDTWKRYAHEGADPTSFTEAVRAAGKYFAASYEYLYNNNLNELDVIESEFFAGDHDAFVRDFVLPVLLNGYNAGDGTMRHALAHFAREYGTQDDLQTFYNTSAQITGKDVFFAFTRIESKNEEVPMYGPYAGAYSLEIAARYQAGTTLPSQTEDYVALAD